MINIKKIIDISLALDEKTIVYPGNLKLKIKKITGKTSTYSEILLGSHSGTHVDAPMHVFSHGWGIDVLPLTNMIGKCRVLDMTKVKESIDVEDLKQAHIKKGERILVKTKNSKIGYKKFRSDYIYLSGDAAEFLAEKEIILFGIDYISIKQRGGKDNRPHTALLKKNIVIAEGLNLSGVDAGTYTLVCLPLKFEGMDGAPARVVLLEM